MPFERDGQPIASPQPTPAPKGLVDAATNDTLANAQFRVEETLSSVDKLLRNIVSDALKEAFAHLDRSVVDVRRSAQESVDHASKALKEALEELDRLVERRIQAVEEGSMQRLKAGIEETVRASARPVRKELDGLLDAITHKLLAVTIPLVTVLIMLRLRTVMEFSESAPRLVGASVAVVGFATGLAGAGELLRRLATRTQLQVKAVFVDLIPFAVASIGLAIAFSL